ncbi:MAG: FecR domain-containing protein [Chloroflexi bacterium]|nr:FecR domain-containing protein [Chloroflexota bacterium]
MINHKPERAAWSVMWGAFFAFLLLAAAIPLGIQYYIEHATTPQLVTLEVIGGTVRVREPNSAAPIAVTKTVQLPEGTAIETDETSRGILTFSDGSTTILFPSTQILVRQMRVATFPWGVEPISIFIDQTRGRVRVGAAQQVSSGGNVPPARVFQVSTAQLLAQLAEGSYAIEVSGDTSQVSVRDGAATVSALGKTVTVGRGQRTLARRDEAPRAAMPAAQDLIVNGDFMDPRSRGWNDQIELPNIPGAPAGQLSIVADGRALLRIQRANSNQTSAITGVAQQINREVSDYRSLRLLADVRVQSHSLSGGGVVSSEYPLILRLKYRDVYGSEAEWVHGFYYQNTANNPTNNGELILSNVWVPYESGNLLETLDPRPFFITSIQVYASGWDYDSFVTGIRLIVE